MDEWFRDLKLSLEHQEAEPFLALEGATLREARFSPDETHVAYPSDESGTRSTSCCFRDRGKWQIPTDGGGAHAAEPVVRYPLLDEEPNAESSDSLLISHGLPLVAPPLR